MQLELGSGPWKHFVLQRIFNFLCQLTREMRELLLTLFYRKSNKLNSEKPYTPLGTAEEQQH